VNSDELGTVDGFQQSGVMKTQAAYTYNANPYFVHAKPSRRVCCAR
jgi:hypothetical protein